MTSGAIARAVRQQGAAMGCELFEVGVFRPETAGTDAGMLLRVWVLDTLQHSVPWLQLQNHAGRHTYIRPKGAHSLGRVDDLKLRLPSARGASPRRVLTNQPSPACTSSRTTATLSRA